MEKNRVKLIAMFLVSAAAVSYDAVACGPFFEEAPPMLPYYLDRLPAKSFGTIYLETSQSRPKEAPPDDAAVLDVADQVSKASRSDLLKRVDQLVITARDNYTDGDWCNLLNDVHDALASKAENDDAANYIRWRVTYKQLFGSEEKIPRDWDWKPPQIAGTKDALDLEKRAADAPAALKPQWLYLRGALGFSGGDRVECAKWFERVWKEFPDHPRAEAALFLSGRCALAQSRSGQYPPYGSSENPAAVEQQKKLDATARALFQSYIEKYPAGRFIADVYGWLGALDFQEGNNAAALRDYIRELETPGHPEVARSALFMCEEVLSDTANDDDAAFAIIAQHPVAAMGATYFMLNDGNHSIEPQGSPQSFDSDNAYHDYESAAEKRWRQTVLPRLAAQVAQQKGHYSPDGWPARYLAILAQAASEVGDQDQALSLTAVRALDQSDDLLLARGIAFQRSGKPREAIAMYQKLLEEFPQSQLVNGTRLKLALALQDNHEAGLAIVELKKLGGDFSKDGQRIGGSEGEDEIYPPGDDIPFTESAVSSDISGADDDEINQVVDSLYNFAPLEELASAVSAPELDDADRRDLRAVLAERYLAQEDFAEAKKFDDSESIQAIAGNLENLTADTAAASAPAAKAQAMLNLGDAWANARQKLLYTPLESGSSTGIFADNSDQAAQRRRENGKALGFKNTDSELDGRDELRHASRWWMRAARTQPGTQLAATARLKALEAMPKIAGASDYAFDRAVETGAGEVSRLLYDRLRTECPGSVEASKEAAYWSFPMRKRQPDETGFLQFKDHSGPEIDAIGDMGYTAFDDGAFGVTRDFTEEDWEPGDGTEKKWDGIRGRVLGLKDHAGDWDTARLATEVEAIRRDTRAIYRVPGASRYLTLLDDLSLFLQEPNLTPEMRRTYIELRLWCGGFLDPENSRPISQADLPWDQWEKMKTLMENPALKPVQDYVDFIRAVEDELAGPTDGQTATTVRSTDLRAHMTWSYQSMERNMRKFLAMYPKSRKREAARLVLARAVHWLTVPTIEMWNPKDDEPDPEKAATMDLPSVLETSWREKFDLKRALEPLDAYDQEFPNGHYAADIRNYRGTAEWQAHEWGAALDDTMANLDDATHPDLQPEAALRLANIFADLADAENRSDLLEAIRQRPKAVERLKQYLGMTWQYRDNPLRYLGAYLADQLGFQYEEPPPPPAGNN